MSGRTDAEPIIPRYYLVEETEAGTRWFYPRPALDRELSYRIDRRTLVWTAPDGTLLPSVAVATGRGYMTENDPYWLASAAELTGAVATWPTARTLAGYVLRDDLPVGLLPLRATYPDAVTPEDWTARCQCDGDDDSDGCPWCVIRQALYAPIYVEPGTDSQMFDFGPLRPLPGAPDPDPSFGWRLTTPALEGFYGRHVTHLFAGYVPDTFGLICAHVAEHVQRERPGSTVYDDKQKRTLRVHLRIPWDVKRPTPPVRGRSRVARELAAQRERTATIAMSATLESSIPNEVHGDTKADALHKLAELIDYYTTLLCPPVVSACAACDGRGYHSHA